MRYNVVIIFYSNWIQHRIDNKNFNVEQSFKTYKESVDCFDSFKNEELSFLGIYDNVKKKFVKEVRNEFNFRPLSMIKI